MELFIYYISVLTIHCGCPVDKAKEEKIICTECGNELKENDKVCSKCGCPIEENINNNVKKGKNKIEQKEQKKSSNVLGYILSAFCLLFFIGVRGIGIVVLLIALVLVCPLTNKMVYNKIKIPKALKIIIPIVLIILSITLTPSFKDGYESGTSSSKSNLNENNIEKYLTIYTGGTTYGNTTFQLRLNINPKESNYTCKDVSFTLNAYVTYEGKKISSEKPIQVKLNDKCKLYNDDETFSLDTNPHASALVKYSISNVKGKINE